MYIPFRALITELSKPNQTLSRTQVLHAFVSKTHLSNDPFYATRLVKLYSIGNDLASAHKLFDGTPHRTVFLWNSIIRAYASSHRYSAAFSLLKQMLSSETKPDRFTFACVLRALSEMFDTEGLRVVHGEIIVSGLELDSICSSALVSGYSRACRVGEAERVFNGIVEPDLVSWNTIISGYACDGDWRKAMEMFIKMRKMGLCPDEYTMVGLISALGNRDLVKMGENVHGFCLKCAFDLDAHVGSALVTMYSRYKCMDLACEVFNSLEHPDLVTWSALITGFSQAGEPGKALYSFRRMNIEGGKADSVLVASVTAASAQLAIVGPGSELHGYAVRRGFHLEVVVSSALVDMYSKCGFLEYAVGVFKTMPKKNLISYNSLISSLGLYGHASAAFEMFEEAITKGIEPDETTFAALLCASYHAGLIDEGLKVFQRMKDEFSIQAKTEHCIYMVKLLGMSTELKKAYEFIMSLPAPVDSAVWGALLSCCEAYGNHELAEIAAQHLFENEPDKICYRVMLSNIYAGDGRWNDANNLRSDVEGSQRKIPGLSWISGS